MALDTVTIGAIAGAALGVVLIVVLVVLIVFITRRMKKKTNTRAKLITSDGEVLKNKWAPDYKEGTKDNKKLYFGDVDRSEHVVVKERRRPHREREVPFAPEMIPPSHIIERRQDVRPPPVVMTPPIPRAVVPTPIKLPPPQQPSPRLLRRYSLPRRQPEQTFKRRPSFNSDKPYFMYGFPYQQQQKMRSANWQQFYKMPAAVVHPYTQYEDTTYGVHIPNNKQEPEPKPQQPKPLQPADDHNNDIEEQERVFIVDDMTEKTFNPRWQGTIRGGDHTAAAGVIASDYEYSYTKVVKETEIPKIPKEVPRIVTEVI